MPTIIYGRGIADWRAFYTDSTEPTTGRVIIAGRATTNIDDLWDDDPPKKRKLFDIIGEPDWVV